MHSIRQPSLAHGAVPMAAAVLCLSMALAAGPAQAVLVTTYNTGAALPYGLPSSLPNGAIDPHYDRVSTIGSGPTPGTLLGSAAVQLLGPASWLSPTFPGGTSEWISPDVNFDGTVPQVNSIHYYQTSFDLSNFTSSTAAMSGRWATDKPLGKIYLNGTDLNLLAGGSGYQPSSPGAWANFTGSGLPFTGALNAGMNYLTFEVNNLGPVGTPFTGLRVEYRVDALPVPEPSTYATFALGLAGLGLARMRRIAAAARQAV